MALKKSLYELSARFNMLVHRGAAPFTIESLSTEEPVIMDSLLETGKIMPAQDQHAEFVGG
jgi:hypothetical protein